MSEGYCLEEGNYPSKNNEKQEMTKTVKNLGYFIEVKIWQNKCKSKKYIVQCVSYSVKGIV